MEAHSNSPRAIDTTSNQASSSTQTKTTVTKRYRPAVNGGRAGKRKVRTGCVTCKARRVKCDETKPLCNRCIKFEVICDGYLEDNKPPQKTPSLPSYTRTILPRSQQPAIVSKPNRLIQQLSRVPPPRKLYTGPRFEEEQEGLCFRIYIEETAAQISGPFSSSLWERLIPQTSEAEPFVRHAVIAIGALSKISHDARNSFKMCGSLQSGNFEAVEYTYALKQYDKALRAMRDAIAKGAHSMRNALIACILVFCFETLHGKAGSAAMNAQSGLMLMYQWKQANVKRRVSFLEGENLQPEIIEEDITTALDHMDLHVMFLVDTRPEAVHLHTIAGCNEALKRMPNEFIDLQDARSFCILILRRNCHFILRVLRAAKCVELCEPWGANSDAQWALEDSTYVFPGVSIFSTPKEPPEEHRGESLRYLEDINQWKRATTTLFEHIATSGTGEQHIVVALLRIHEITSRIMLVGAFFVTEMAYDQFLPEFTEIVSLVEYVHPHLVASVEGSTLYKFDMGIVTPLYLVGSRCRDYTTRKRAIDLMLSTPYREGLWDCEAVGAMSNWIMKIEEEGVDENEFIPEHRRAFMTSVYSELVSRKAVSGCTQKGFDALVFRKELVCW